MFRDSYNKFHSNKDITGSQAELNVSAAAQSGSNITAPALTKNTITGNVHIIHNAPGFTGYHRYSEKTQTSEISSAIHKYKKLICSEYQYVTEYNSLPGEHVLLSERFTQPLILKNHRDPREREEEICSSGERFQQVLSFRSSEDSVHLNSLFDPDGHGISPRAVILQGNSGNGKTFTVQKIMMDWASGDLYKERFDIVFHLKCKEINRIPGKNSLAEILSYSCSLTSDQISQMLQHSPEKVLFIIDGFDELKLTQDIYHTSPNTDLLQKASPEVILCDLLRGRILRESFLLVTSRSTATDTLSKLLKGPQSFSEIIGFSEKGVEEYFQKFFQNEALFRKAYTLVKPNETLITACSIPVVCWIICTTIQERFKIGADITRGLETTTSIYVDFVSTLLEHHCQGLSQSVPTLLRSLGQLAERGILEQQVLFDEKSVNETVSDPACSPFLCKFLFKRRIHSETMFSFMHLSFQEFFTALYFVLLDEEESQRKFTQLFSIHEKAGGFSRGISRLTAVMQFAFGLLNKDVRDTLGKKHGLFVHPNTEAYLKKMILTEIQKETWDSYTICFWIHCLYELHEEDFVKKAMESTPHITMYGSVILRRIDCWALLYCSLCCECIEELALHDCRLSSEKLSIILPALCKFKNLTLSPEGLSYAELAELMFTLTRRKTLIIKSACIRPYIKDWSVERVELFIREDEYSMRISSTRDPKQSLISLFLTFPHSELISIDWTKLFQIYERKSSALLPFLRSFFELKKMEMTLDVLNRKWSVQILHIIQKFPSLTELSVHAYFLPEEGIEILQRSCVRPACDLSFSGSTHLHLVLNLETFFSCNNVIYLF
ncbi:NACHT, LRR and PYD domains-containing protein 1 homolog isoform X2 [Megalobrama amblycephala]|uniref:NACHT, LRR and PYD domains-containing protein 1 homolog isoform X2 n=1 Tax=Megalobrama amblycephala TaxID=75352 RepID=UPI002013D8FE|nr:NACHT, LRR and PYD domains-containing protein 1 homolog isoform X2 [Megalobrama amblycephala]